MRKKALSLPEGFNVSAAAISNLRAIELRYLRHEVMALQRCVQAFEKRVAALEERDKQPAE